MQNPATGYIRPRSTILHLIDKILENPDVTLYFSHIKKEILPNIQEDKATASDILTQFHGADFIGTDREPWRRSQVNGNNDDAARELASKHNFASKEDYLEAHAFHKHRIFDPARWANRSLIVCRTTSSVKSRRP